MAVLLRTAWSGDRAARIVLVALCVLLATIVHDLASQSHLWVGSLMPFGLGEHQRRSMVTIHLASVRAMFQQILDDADVVFPRGGHQRCPPVTRSSVHIRAMLRQQVRCLGVWLRLTEPRAASNGVR